MTERIVELNSVDYEVTSASMGHGRNGAVFRCTLRPVTDAVLEELELAAQSDGMVRLVFPKEPLLLERIDVQQVEPGCVRLAGRVTSK
ncbi:MAG TPA: hypothetical protein VM692_03275 [Gammaproteobacteria bacterium]|nr:hypothetical protein [Gammaproteobacteria bacterium]